MTNEKIRTQRSYDEDGYMKRAACVCVKNENENEVLLISSNKNKQHWIIPGGGVENNENAEEAAEREVFEEAGVLGRLGRLLGVFENRERKDRTTVYVLIVEKELSEWEENTKFGRIRKWFYVDEAKSELEKHKPVQGAYLNLLKGFHHHHHPHQAVVVDRPLTTIMRPNAGDIDLVDHNISNKSNNNHITSITNIGNSSINSSISPMQKRSYYKQKPLTNSTTGNRNSLPAAEPVMTYFSKFDHLYDNVNSVNSMLANDNASRRKIKS